MTGSSGWVLSAPLAGHARHVSLHRCRAQDATPKGKEERGVAGPERSCPRHPAGTPSFRRRRGPGSSRARRDGVGTAVWPEAPEPALSGTWRADLGGKNLLTDHFQGQGRWALHQGWKLPKATRRFLPFVGRDRVPGSSATCAAPVAWWIRRGSPAQEPIIARGPRALFHHRFYINNKTEGVQLESRE